MLLGEWKKCRANIGTRTQAAQHGNVDAQDRLEALAISEANTLNRIDHEAHVDNKLVRKRTQAQARSNEQRERLAATNLAASLSGGNPASLPPPRNPYAQPQLQQPPQQQYQQQQQYSQPPPQQQQLYQQQQGRPTSAISQASSNGRLQRQNTLNQVQAAAGIGPNRMTPLASGSVGPGPGPGAARPMPQQRPSQQGSLGGRPGVQLADSRPGSGQSGGPPRARPQEIPLANPNKPATFAEMGIVTQKAKKDDCAVRTLLSSL